MRHPIDAYAEAFAALTPDTLPELLNLMHAEVRFSDPFHTVNGKEAVAAVFKRMFERTDSPRFAIHSVTPHDGRMAYVHWRFTCHSRRGNLFFEIDGLSQVHFHYTGLVLEHRDYWDASTQFYGKIPVLGSLIRLVATRA